MLIGIDFDHALVSYDSLFHRFAVEQGWIPVEVPQAKMQVREYLLRAGKADAWDELQTQVYGSRINEAAPRDGAIDFLRACRKAQVPVRIITHKARFPFRGPSCDLHQAAFGWLEHHGLSGPRNGLTRAGEIFDTTRATKLGRIAQQHCTHFVDGQTDLLLDAAFPTGTQRWLFDPENHHAREGRLARAASWQQLKDLLLGVTKQAG